MFNEFRKRRANKDILDAPDWAYWLYPIPSTFISIWLAYRFSAFTPTWIGAWNIFASLMVAFLAIGILLREWLLNSLTIKIWRPVSLMLGISVVVFLIPFNKVPQAWNTALMLVIAVIQWVSFWQRRKKTKNISPA